MSKINKIKVWHALISVAVIIVVMVLLSPILLIFTESKDGSITIWNFVGIAYLLMVVWLGGRVNKYYKAKNNG